MTVRGWVWAGLLLAACNRGATPAPPVDTTRMTHESTPAPAMQVPAPDTADPCASATTQLALNACWGEQARVSDSLETAQLQVAIEYLKARKQADAVTALEAAEQAWKLYVDAQCKAEMAAYAGGSAAPMIGAGCRRRESRARIGLLREVYNSP